MFSGYLPYSEYGQLFQPSWVYLSKQMLNETDLETFFINSNAWVGNLQPRSYKEYKYYESHKCEDMVIKCLQLMQMYPDVFISLLFTETHGPYDLPEEDEETTKKVIKKFKDFNHGVTNTAPELAGVRQVETIEYLDKKIKPLLDLADRVIFTSDHGDLMGEEHKIGHDPTFPQHKKLYEVPLIISGEF
jgi:hypothetical protein